jgi:putative addiction module antidote
MRRKITTVGNSAALVLTQDMLGHLGIRAGDEVDVSFSDQSLLVRPISEIRRRAAIARAEDRVFREYADVFRALATDSVAPARPRKKRAR